MFRYVALAWDAGSQEQEHAVRTLAATFSQDKASWRTTLDVPGLRVYSSGSIADGNDTLVLGSNGVILGTLFRRADEERASAPLKLSASEAAAILTSRGRALVDSFWGHYVAFLNDTPAATRRVLRDPSGAMDCLMAEFQGVRVFFSDLSTLPCEPLLRFTFNWDYVAAAVCCSMMSDSRETGFAEVTRVLAGECCTIAARKLSSEFYWDPCRIASSQIVANLDEAARQVRAAVKTSVESWASRHERLVHLLSGGLDSSIVFAFLKRAPAAPNITCINHYHSPGSIGDEREFARLCMQETDDRCTLVELPVDTHLDFAAVLQPPKTCYPVNCFGQGAARQNIDIARSNGATACFSGTGGDELFYQTAQFVCADYARAHGRGPALFRAAMHMARVERNSVWRILGSAIRDGLREHPLVPLLRDCIGYAKYMTQSAAEDVQRRQLFLHPWLKRRELPPPGKCWQIFGLSRPSPMYEPFSQPGDPESIDPLLSQPVVEACLRIPTYVLAARGRDRVVARRAFADDLPSAIVKRRAKGITHGYIQDLLLQNMQHMRELLLDGALVREGIVDRRYLALTLSDTPAKDSAYGPDLFLCFSVEAWLNAWQARPRSRAAA
jgi:asparagine synthase (glutamine-hydrolysing)